MANQTACVTVACILGLCTFNTANSQVVFDASNGFSLSANPNGVWSYGTFASGVINPNSFALNAYPHSEQGIDFYSSVFGPPPTLDNTYPPYVSHNPSSSPVAIIGGTIIYQGNQVGLHPGMAGEFSVLRFVSPFPGEFEIAATFSAIDFLQGTTTDVHIWRNSTALFSGVINPGTSAPFSTSSPIHLDQSDSLYFIVGFGNGNFFNDSTGLFATVTAVPEPSSFCLIACAVGAVVGKGKLKRRCRA